MSSGADSTFGAAFIGFAVSSLYVYTAALLDFLTVPLTRSRQVLGHPEHPGVLVLQALPAGQDVVQATGTS